MGRRRRHHQDGLFAEHRGDDRLGCDRLRQAEESRSRPVHGYQPYLGSVLLWLQGTGIPTGVGIPPVPVLPAPFAFAPAVAAGEAASGAAGHDFDISTLKPCAYILYMSATVRLTEGWGSSRTQPTGT